MECLHSYYRCNVADQLRGYRGAQRHDKHGVDRVPGTPALFKLRSDLNNVELTGFLGAQRTKFLVKRLVEQSRSAAEKATNQVYYL